MKSNDICDLVQCALSPSTRREWIEMHTVSTRLHALPSPSTRREWIEISSLLHCHCIGASPSTRREWIEIQRYKLPDDGVVMVSLHTEGVD